MTYMQQPSPPPSPDRESQHDDEGAHNLLREDDRQHESLAHEETPPPTLDPSYITSSFPPQPRRTGRGLNPDPKDPSSVPRTPDLVSAPHTPNPNVTTTQESTSIFNPLPERDQESSHTTGSRDSSSNILYSLNSPLTTIPFPSYTLYSDQRPFPRDIWINEFAYDPVLPAWDPTDPNSYVPWPEQDDEDVVRALARIPNTPHKEMINYADTDGNLRYMMLKAPEVFQRAWVQVMRYYDCAMLGKREGLLALVAAHAKIRGLLRDVERLEGEGKNNEEYIEYLQGEWGRMEGMLRRAGALLKRMRQEWRERVSELEEAVVRCGGVEVAMGIVKGLEGESGSEVGTSPVRDPDPDQEEEEEEEEEEEKEKGELPVREEDVNITARDKVLANRVKKLVEAIDALGIQTTTNRAEIKHLQLTIASLRTQLRKAKLSAQQAVSSATQMTQAQLEQEHAVRIRELEDQLQSVQDELRKTKHELAAVRDQAKTRQEQDAKKIADLRRRYEEAARGRQSNLVRYKRERDQLATQIRDWKRKERELRQRLADMLVVSSHDLDRYQECRRTFLAWVEDMMYATWGEAKQGVPGEFVSFADRNDALLAVQYMQKEASRYAGLQEGLFRKTNEALEKVKGKIELLSSMREQFMEMVLPHLDEFAGLQVTNRYRSHWLYVDRNLQDVVKQLGETLEDVWTRQGEAEQNFRYQKEWVERMHKKLRDHEEFLREKITEAGRMLRELAFPGHHQERVLTKLATDPVYEERDWLWREIVDADDVAIKALEEARRVGREIRQKAPRVGVFQAILRGVEKLEEVVADLRGIDPHTPAEQAIVEFMRKLREKSLEVRDEEPQGQPQAQGQAQGQAQEQPQDQPEKAQDSPQAQEQADPKSADLSPPLLALNALLDQQDVHFSLLLSQERRAIHKFLLHDRHLLQKVENELSALRKLSQRQNALMHEYLLAWESHTSMRLSKGRMQDLYLTVGAFIEEGGLMDERMIWYDKEEVLRRIEGVSGDGGFRRKRAEIRGMIQELRLQVERVKRAMREVEARPQRLESEIAVLEEAALRGRLREGRMKGDLWYSLQRREAKIRRQKQVYWAMLALLGPPHEERVKMWLEEREVEAKRRCEALLTDTLARLQASAPAGHAEGLCFCSLVRAFWPQRFFAAVSMGCCVSNAVPNGPERLLVAPGVAALRKDQGQQQEENPERPQQTQQGQQQGQTQEQGQQEALQAWQGENPDPGHQDLPFHTLPLGGPPRYQPTPLLFGVPPHTCHSYHGHGPILSSSSLATLICHLLTSTLWLILLLLYNPYHMWKTILFLLGAAFIQVPYFLGEIVFLTARHVLACGRAFVFRGFSTSVRMLMLMRRDRRRRRGGGPVPVTLAAALRAQQRLVELGTPPTVASLWAALRNTKEMHLRALRQGRLARFNRFRVPFSRMPTPGGLVLSLLTFFFLFTMLTYLALLSERRIWLQSNDWRGAYLAELARGVYSTGTRVAADGERAVGGWGKDYYAAWSPVSVDYRLVVEPVWAKVEQGAKWVIFGSAHGVARLLGWEGEEFVIKLGRWVKDV